MVTSTGLPATLAANTLTVLTDAPVRIAVTSPDLKPGLLADVTLTFAKAGPVTLVAPVLSSDEPEFSTSPSAVRRPTAGRARRDRSTVGQACPDLSG